MENESEKRPETHETEPQTEGKPRGFAVMPPERQKQIASLGGKTAHARGAAHKFSQAEARQAGHKGGVAVSRDIEHMSEIGRRGGLARGETMRSRFSMSMSSIEVSIETKDGVTVSRASAEQVHIETAQVRRK